MTESRRERKARQRWEREMLRRLEELDELDRRYGLGASPAAHPAPRSGSGPRHRRRDRAEGHRARRQAGPVLPGLLVVLCLLLFVFFKSPTTTGERLRQFVDGLTGGDESFAFVAEGPNGLPVGWDSCRPITYVVNPDGAPENWKDVVEDAVSEVADASGYRFDYEGTSSERWSARREAGLRPVLIDWATPEEEPRLEGNTVGIGGGSAVTANGTTRYVTGAVVLDEEEYAGMFRNGRYQAAVLILAHELGHVLGLDHVDDPNQLMHAKYVGQRGFGDGDRAGFKELHDLPCG